ncbi:MAG TPA: hypothetical protein VFV71_03225 [Burkholderiales bacterium]|nr:hypothetical protein [Burkholderiales bacterium]
MKSRTLFSALAAAQSGRPPAAHQQPCIADEVTLLNALRNSATDRDQILRRRLGLVDDPKTF